MAHDADPSRPQRAPFPVRLLFPSITDLIFASLLVAFALTVRGTNMLADSSVGWHIRTGDYILATHSIPKTDLYSFTKAGAPWFAWEWLWDAIAAWIHAHAGLNGIVTATALLLASIFTGLFRITLRDRALLPIGAGLTLLAVGASSIHFLTRPHVVSWAFILLWVEQLRRLYLGRPTRLWVMPLTMLLWVNLHGAFFLGLVLQGLTGAALAWDWSRRPADRARTAASLLRLAAILAMSLAATFATPYGYHLHVHVAEYLTSIQLHKIDEFLSPDFHTTQPRLFAVLLVLTLAALAAGRTVTALDVLLVLFATYSALFAKRSIPTSSLLLVPIAARLLTEAVETARERGATVVQRAARALTAFSARMQAMEARLDLHGIAVAVAAATLLIAFNGGRVGGTVIVAHAFQPKQAPVAAARFLVDDMGVRDRFFSTDTWGGYLIYNYSDRGLRVGVDDRSDFYGDAFLLRYIDLVTAKPNWVQVLREWEMDYALVPSDSTLATLLRASPAWEQKFRDDTASVFARRATAVQR